MKSIILLSGGIDSFTALSISKKRGKDLIALTFDYNQRNQFEIEASKEICQALGIKEHLIISIDSSYTNSFSELNSDNYISKNNEIVSTYYPARNIIFLSYAVSLAESRNCKEIIYGCNKEDSKDYPDCRLEFVSSFQKMIAKGTYLGKDIKISTPFINLTKAEIIQLGLSNNLDYGISQSCYFPKKNGKPCLECDSCKLRNNAFNLIEIKDPLI